MKSLFRAVAILALGLVAAIAAVIHAGNAEWLDGEVVRVPVTPPLLAQQPAAPASPNNPTDLLSSACAVKPVPTPNKLRRLPAIRGTVSLTRFRRESSDLSATRSNYTPREEVILAHPTNFGRRFLQDLNGNPVDNEPIIVIHETVGSARSTINYFRTPHPRDNDQVSYHTLIREDGTIVYMVPPDRRAFGAGNSVFVGAKGNEGVKTNPSLPASVNNFAYHISLVTPPDGRNNANSHGGYTRAQYDSLAWLVAKTGVPDARITTHKGVDRSRQRKDPRSFNSEYFSRLLYQYPRINDIPMQCTTPAIAREE